MDHGGQRRTYGLLLVLALLVAACSGSAEITETPAQEAPTVEPPAEPSSGNATQPDESATTESVTEADESPTSPTAPSTDATQLPSAPFETDRLMALSSDAEFAYAATTAFWFDETSCDADPFEALAVVNVADAAAGTFAPVVAGLMQAGDVGQVVVGPANKVAILSGCYDEDRNVVEWLTIAEVGARGQLGSVSEPLRIATAAVENGAFIVGWEDDTTIEMQLAIKPNDDTTSWIDERQLISTVDGASTLVGQYERYDFEAYPPLEWQSAPGVIYRQVQDPQGRVGCEGYGFSQTIELDRGGETRLAVPPEFVMPSIIDLHFTPTGHVGWTTGCEGFLTAYVAKLLPDGTFVDVHDVATYQVPGYEATDFRLLRLTNDGFLHGVGTSFATEEPELAFLRYDLAADPDFVNTANPAPQIGDAEWTGLGGGTWHVGETLAATPACGATTLYSNTSSGYGRAFDAGIEIDTIVDVELGDIHVRTFDQDEYQQRAVVLEVECPADYEGRRVWFATEFDQEVWGLWLEQADLGEVRDVLGIRYVFEGGADYIAQTFIEVELLDGTVAEVELVAVPFEG